MSQHVIFHICLLGEPTTAYVTSERPRAIVGVHVAPEIARSRKRLGAFGALVWLLACMRQLVVVQVGAGRKLFAAQIARVRLLATVYASVRVERGRGGKSFATNVARVWLLARVRAYMTL